MESDFLEIIVSFNYFILSIRHLDVSDGYEEMLENDPRCLKTVLSLEVNDEQYVTDIT